MAEETEAPVERAKRGNRRTRSCSARHGGNKCNVAYDVKTQRSQTSPDSDSDSADNRSNEGNAFDTKQRSPTSIDVAS